MELPYTTKVQELLTELAHLIRLIHSSVCGSHRQPYEVILARLTSAHEMIDALLIEVQMEDSNGLDA
jgi:hypothetical protein